jgi:hypothetical protein
MLRPDSMSVNKLNTISEELTNWFNPVMTQKMIAAVLPPADDSPALTATVPLSGGEATMQPPEPSFLLDETFAIYMLGQDKIAEAIHSERSLVELVRNTDRFHHQIRTDSRPTGYAQTEMHADGTTEVCGLFVSSLAQAFDNTIEWLLQYERENPDDVKTEPLVRVLAVPSYHVNAFWLFNEESGRSDFVVIDAPLEMKGLEGKRLLSSEEFLKAFEGVSPKSGLIFGADLTSGPPPSSRASSH